MKSSGCDGERDSSLPANGFFDLLRRAAIFFGQAGDGLPGVETRGDYSSRDICSRDNWFSKANHWIDFDDLGLGRTRLDYKRETLEETLGVRFHSFQMHEVEIQTELILLMRNIDDLTHTFDE